MSSKPEHRESLWWLVVSPTLWALHFVLSYATVAIWCGKAVPRDGSLGAAKTALIVYTLVALAGVIATGLRSHRRHRFGDSELPHDTDTPEDRHRFLGFAAYLLSGLSAIAIVFVAMPLIFISTCR